MYRNCFFISLFSLLILCSCEETNSDNLVQNPNSGEFGEVGKEVVKEYDYSFDLIQTPGKWFISKLDTCHQDSLREELIGSYEYLHRQIPIKEDSLQRLAYLIRLVPGNLFSLRSGVCVDDSLVSPDGYETARMYEGHVLQMLEFEDYADVARVRGQLDEYVQDADLQMNGSFWIEFSIGQDTCCQELEVRSICQPIQKP